MLSSHSTMKVHFSLCLLLTSAVIAQDRLKTMPGYEQHEKISGQINGSVKFGALNATWINASTFEYSRDGKQYSYDVTTRQAKEIEAATPTHGRGGAGRG